MNPSHSPYLHVSAEVADALAGRYPLVALESTIIAHGMPFPRNVETALRVEQAVRDNGAVPATVAVLDGRLCVGLTQEEIEQIGRAGTAVVKVSRRDLPLVLVRRQLGATTVAATMIAAGLARIPIFATGGIGGVHRGAAETMDVSADLQELARTNVAIVSAGAKSILDLALTLEYLETHGVPVIGVGTDEFPAFYSRSSGLPVDYRVDDPRELAQLLRVKWELGLHGGVLIANPIPEKYSLDRSEMEAATGQALDEARAKAVRGKATTPFLLARIEQLTGGLSLEANIELVLNNARLAANVAAALAARPV